MPKPELTHTKYESQKPSVTGRDKGKTSSAHCEVLGELGNSHSKSQSLTPSSAMSAFEEAIRSMSRSRLPNSNEAKHKSQFVNHPLGIKV